LTKWPKCAIIFCYSSLHYSNRRERALKAFFLGGLNLHTTEDKEMKFVLVFVLLVVLAGAFLCTKVETDANKRHQEAPSVVLPSGATSVEGRAQERRYQ